MVKVTAKVIISCVLKLVKMLQKEVQLSNEETSVYDERRKQVDKHIRDLGGNNIVKDEQLTPYSFRYEIKYDKDLNGIFKKN